jgi:hypothetical protein
MVDQSRAVGFAHKLLVFDHAIPENWNRDIIQRALEWRPVISDLIFNYLDASIRADLAEAKSEGKAPGEVIEETELALILLTNLIEGILGWMPGAGSIRVDDVAYHFCSRA